MQKISLIAITILLAANLCGCSRKAEPAPTQPQDSTQPSTVAPSTMPEMDPTLDTNIPDPTVNENSLGMDMDLNDSSTTPTAGTENNNISTDNNANGLDNSARQRMFHK